MLKRYKDIIAGTLVILLAAIIFSATFSIRHLVGMDIDATFFPRIAAGGLTFLGVLVIIEGGIALKKAPTASEKGNSPTLRLSSGAICTILTLLLIAIYIFVMSYLGFVVSTALYLICQMVVLSPKESRRYLLFAIISVVTAVLVNYIFVKFFYLTLPMGIFG